MIGAPTGAQSADVRAVLVSVDSAGAALAGTNTGPSVSDDGNRIVFTHRSAAAPDVAAPYDLVVRRRATGTEPAASLVIGVASSDPVAAAISGDGCTVAYSVMVPRPAGEAQVEALTVVELRTVDVCGAPGVVPEPVVIDRVEGAAPLAAPALSTDGSTSAWATGTTVRVYRSSLAAPKPVAVEIDTPLADDRVGPQLDITGDGLTVVFESGPVTADPNDGAAAIDADVYLATLTSTGDATPPTVVVELFAPSDAGSSWPTISADGTLVVYQSDRQLPIAGIPATGNYLVVAERAAAGTTHRLLTDVAVRPDLSADGSTVVYDVIGSVQIRRSDAASAVPFGSFTEKIVNRKLGVDFVEGAGASITGPVVSSTGGVVVFDQPPAAQLSSPVPAGQHVWLQESAPLFAPTPSPTTVSSPTSTTTIAATSPTVSVSNTTATTTRNTTRTTTRNTTPNTTRTTTRNTTRSTPSTVVGATATFEPATFEFAPTIINAGRRTADVALVSGSASGNTAASVSVASIVVDAGADGDFTVDPTTCTSLAPGSRCNVSVTFAPVATGERTATMIATMTDGSTATIALRGVGAPEPSLTVVPGVAANGQVISVLGSGFPAGATVEVEGLDGRVISAVLIDDTGGFAEALVVLPNTPTGPATVTVLGQTDLFGDVSAAVLVTASSNGGNPAVLGGGVLGR